MTIIRLFALYALVRTLLSFLYALVRPFLRFGSTMHMNDYSHVMLSNRVAQRTADKSSLHSTLHLFFSVRDKGMPSEE